MFFDDYVFVDEIDPKHAWHDPELFDEIDPDVISDAYLDLALDHPTERTDGDTIAHLHELALRCAAIGSWAVTTKTVAREELSEAAYTLVRKDLREAIALSMRALALTERATRSIDLFEGGEQ